MQNNEHTCLFHLIITYQVPREMLLELYLLFNRACTTKDLKHFTFCPGNFLCNIIFYKLSYLCSIDDKISARHTQLRVQ